MHATVRSAMSVLPMLIVACNPLQDLERFDVAGEQVISIPGKNIVSDPLSVIDVGDIGDALAQSLSQTFENQGVDKNDVDSFVTKAILLEVTGPADRDGQMLQDLRFLDHVVFSLSAEGLDSVELSRSSDDAFGSGVTRYDFAVDAKRNLKNFLVAPSMTLSVDAKANDRPTLGCDLRFSVVFSVDVNPGGLLD